MPLPTAKEFRKAFLDAFDECRKKAPRCSFEESRAKWTSFMTGKKTKTVSWGKRAVLLKVAKKFGLRSQPEFLRLDLVFYKKGGCPLAVAIEHENDPHDHPETELERLFSVRSRLKVGINYARHGSQKFDQVRTRLECKIREYYAYYVRGDLPECPESEYLFLLGNEQAQKSITWYHLSFKASRGPGKRSFEISR